jgi:hypothetical protein
MRFRRRPDLWQVTLIGVGLTLTVAWIGLLLWVMARLLVF